jgi:hypothetical protein
MPRSEAEEWQRRLDSLSDDARLTDRKILLGLEVDSTTLDGGLPKNVTRASAAWFISVPPTGSARTYYDRITEMRDQFEGLRRR